jgi:hypothetical protein
MLSKRLIVILFAGVVAVAAAASAIAASGLVGPVAVNPAGEPVIKSPNGQFSITVGNAGITLSGPAGKITFTTTALRTMVSNLDLRASSNVTLQASSGALVKAGDTVTLTAGNKVQLNGCATQVARQGDGVSAPGGTGRIIAGSPSVCIG